MIYCITQFQNETVSYGTKEKSHSWCFNSSLAGTSNRDCASTRTKLTTCSDSYCAYLGSKRGVTRGVGPIIKEESSMVLAGVTKGFLVDLNADRNISVYHSYWVLVISMLKIMTKSVGKEVCKKEKKS